MRRSRVTFRCRPSTIHAIFASISHHITDEVREILKRLRVEQFTRMPPIPLTASAITEILSCWNTEKHAFLIGGQFLPFTADEVALIIGMPNRGERVLYSKGGVSKISSIDIKNKIEQLDSGLTPPEFVQLFLEFLLSNLFFIYHNYRVPAAVFHYASNIDQFADCNWPEAISGFLTP